MSRQSVGRRFHVPLVAIIAILIQGAVHADPGDTVDVIAFGSCVKQGKAQPVWEAIVKRKPDVFVFLGDNIYGDTQDMNVMRAKYAQLANEPVFGQLRRQCPIIATWDDHDYGVNDGGREYPMKRESQQVFLDFLGVPTDSPRRKQEGIYHATTFGRGDQAIQFIMLDTRYFRSKLVKRGSQWIPALGRRGPYSTNDDPKSTILGETQWQWLEQQLKQPAAIRIIGTSIQAIPNDHHWEKWGNFPHERDRLFNLIETTKANGVILVSGDRHHAEISRMTVGDRPIYEVTSSGLNQPKRWQNEVNAYRIGRQYDESNFGSIDIDWTASDPIIKLQVHDVKGNLILQQVVSLSELQAK